MTKKEKHEKLKDNIIQTHLGLEIEKNQKEYSNLVIEDRAIPSALDGLKPVNKRILYSFKFNNFLNKNIKSAKLVGACIGSFHPHGDLSVYKALVDMTQPFKNRFPFTKGQGNWGNIEGDSQAAQRYTEIRLNSDYSELLFENIDKDNVITWKSNYDDTLKEPKILPVKYPVALLNETSGIAYAGITTKIPSYNIQELTNLYIFLIEKNFWEKKFKIEKYKKEILNIIKGVDLPTGTNIYFEKENKPEDMIFKSEFIFRMRSSYTIDNRKKIITFFNIPFGVNASKIKLQASNAGLSFITQKNKQIPKKSSDILNIKENIDIEVYSTFNDKEYKNDAKLTFTFKKDSNLDLELKKIFKFTDLDTSFTAKMMFIDKFGRPKLMSLYEQTFQFLEFKLHNYYQSFIYDIKKLEYKLHLLKGLLKIFDNLDTFIDIVKNNTDRNIYIKSKKIFELDDIQIEYLLNIQLRKLSKTSLIKLKSEIKEKENLLKELNKNIASKKNLYNVIKKDYQTLLTKPIFKDKKNKRITKIIKVDNNINEVDLLENKEVVIMYLNNKTIAYIDKTKYKRKKSGTKISDNKINMPFELKLKIEEFCNLKDEILIITNMGRLFKIKVLDLNETFKYIGNIISLLKDEEIISIKKYNIKEKYYFINTKNGKTKAIKQTFINKINSSRPVTIINLDKEDELISFISFNKNVNEKVIYITDSGKILKYKTNEIPFHSNGNTKGIKGITLNNEKVIKNIIYNENQKTIIIAISDTAKIKKTIIKNIPEKRKGGTPVFFYFNNASNGNILCSKVIENEENEIIMLIDLQANVVFIKPKNLNFLPRSSKNSISIININIIKCKKNNINDLTNMQKEIII